ncbi:WhiB family transcriptional regulator [Streptomyces sp. NBC_01233]|uniref:WhiB family transcriptional regulator n=1 Tax=Streptomyces sp. NBC_01233 TaxID=2903787 RepID=UPI002E15882D|nr:WhiB family transcriptional regulator [Streptomyces sp. NBC_01233]
MNNPQSAPVHFDNQSSSYPSPACSGMDPALFFPQPGGSLEEDHIQAAKHLCEVCTVRVGCLASALRFSADDGIWGGYTPQERRRLRKQATLWQRPDPLTIERILRGSKVHIEFKNRPAVIVRLRRLGWSELRIAKALDLTPFAVQAAARNARDVELFLRAEGLAFCSDPHVAS